MFDCEWLVQFKCETNLTAYRRESMRHNARLRECAHHASHAAGNDIFHCRESGRRLLLLLLKIEIRRWLFGFPYIKNVFPTPASIRSYKKDGTSSRTPQRFVFSVVNPSFKCFMLHEPFPQVFGTSALHVLIVLNTEGLGT
jgi:hypothetical protein